MAHDHHHAAQPVQPWPGGWLWALVAGIVAAILSSWLGDITTVTAVLIGIFTFLVFGVLLGQFWDAPSPNALGEHAGGHHGHDGHGHDGHDGHGHGEHGDDHVRGDDQGHGQGTAAVAAPVAAAPAAAAALADPSGKPAGLSAPRGGKPDNLQLLEGIGPALERLCHELGIYHYDQIAGWGAAEVAWMDGNLKGFKGRVTRDRWVAQAKIIVTEGVEAFRRRGKTNDY